MRMPSEARPFFTTSEFLAGIAALLALAIATAVSDSLDASLLWRLATFSQSRTS